MVDLCSQGGPPRDQELSQDNRRGTAYLSRFRSMASKHLLRYLRQKLITLFFQRLFNLENIRQWRDNRRCPARP